jgi:hypothetical protein
MANLNTPIFINEGNYANWTDFLKLNMKWKNSYIILHVNIRSIIKNFSQLEYIVSSSQHIIHAIAITEANISENCKKLFELTNYDMYTELRTNKRGGGIILYVHNSAHFYRKTVDTKSFECITGEIVTYQGMKSNLIITYRPPQLNKSTFIRELSQLVQQYQPRSTCVLLGDMNIDLKSCSPAVTDYLNKLSETGLESGINQYTRIEKRGEAISKSCIDHIFVRSSNCSEVYTAVINNALADHLITGCVITSDAADRHNNHQFQFVNKLNNAKVHNELKKTNWNIALAYNNPNDILNFITKKFLQIYDRCTYLTKIKLNKRSTCKWINTKITNMSKKRFELYNIWRKDENNKLKRLLYNKYRNKTNKVIENTRNKYIKNEICINFRNPRKVWDIINRISGRIGKCIDSIIMKHFKTNVKKLTNVFANEFKKNVKNISVQCRTPLLNPKLYCNTPHLTMRLKWADHHTVFNIIKKLNDNKSPGADRIRASDLKYIITEITPLITHLINACIRTSSYPDGLKVGIIRPIHKKGSYTDYNNYRPITILPCIDKIVERYIGTELNKFLNNNKIINANQYGFQRNRSTTQLLTKFTNEVNDYLNERKHVITTFIDFSKAFDCLNYYTLYSKLQQNGIQGPLLQWFQDYHNNRHTVVKIAGARSEPLRTEEGTAQGSIAGPTEYLIYVNDMCNIFSSGSVYQFADDTCLVTSHRDLLEAQNAMQNNFDQLCKWAHDVGLVINSKKTKVVHIRSPYTKEPRAPTIIAHDHHCLHNPNRNCKCEALELVPQHMYLGLIIDNTFNWKPHVDHVCSKLRCILANIAILKYKLPYNILRMLYLSLADSIICYGITSYGRTYKTYLTQIYKLQLTLLKTIVPNTVKINYRDNKKGLFKHCKVINVFNRFCLSLLTEECATLPSLEKKTRPNKLRTLDYLPPYLLPRNNNTYGNRTTHFLLPSILNNLPKNLLQDLTDTRTIISHNKCKKLLKSYYLNLDE